MMEGDKNSHSRRDFLKTAVTGIAALTIVPSRVIGGLGYPAPASQLNIAAIGVGGIGFHNLNNLRDENITALCDVDKQYALKSFRRWSSASRYTDFRIMLEKEKNIDAVVIASPDHTHAMAAVMAMQLGKHVFVQSPMARSVYEIRRMTETSKVYDVATQVGNAVASSDMTRTIAELFWSGAIGEVREVHAWCSGPEWTQGEPLTGKKEYVPKDLDWNMFVGPSEFREYSEVYTPYGWRGWWNFGSGALGALAPQVLEPVFRALKLGVVSSVEASSTIYDLEMAPKAEKIVFEFNRRDNLPKVSMPPVTLTWYDGGLLPDFPDNVPADFSFADFRCGFILYGNDGMIVANTETEKYYLIRNRQIEEVEAAQSLHRIQDSTAGHEADWVRACKESAGNRLAASANFESQVALSESIQVANMALRMQSLRKALQWDALRMRFSNMGTDEEFEISSPSEFVVEKGIPAFNQKTQRFNAVDFVEKAVRPAYRQGWNL